MAKAQRSLNYHLFQVGDIWHYRFQIGRARVQRSTRETVKRRGAAVAQRAYDHAKLWARGDEPVPTLREIIADWLVAHARVASSAHLKSVRTFCELHLYDMGDTLIDEITTDQVERARNLHLLTHAPATGNHWLRILKLLCRWAVDRKIVPSVTWKVKQVKVQKRPRRTLAVSVTKQWIGEIDLLAVRRPELSLAIRMMLGLGLRESETISARWEWIDWDRKRYTPGITKGREADPLPIPDWLMDRLKATRRKRGLIVCNAAGLPYGAGFTRRIIRAANDACGIDGLTPHRLRGTLATLLSEHGTSVQNVQRVLRHKNTATTMAYLEEDMSLVSDAQARIAHATGLA